MQEMAQSADQSAGADTKSQMCTFWLAGRLFGVDILHVKEINLETGFSIIHHAPEQVRGYVNIRGQIHLVLDLRLMLGFEKGAVGTDSRVVIFNSGVGEPFGVMVDKIGDIVEVSHDQIEMRGTQDEDMHEEGSKLILGECKLENQLLIVLNPRIFLKTVEGTK